MIRAVLSDTGRICFINSRLPSFACICGLFACQWQPRPYSIRHLRSILELICPIASSNNRAIRLALYRALANEEETNKVSTVCSSVLSSMVCLGFIHPVALCIIYTPAALVRGGSALLWFLFPFHLVPGTDVLVLISLKVSNRCMC